MLIFKYPFDNPIAFDWITRQCREVNGEPTVANLTTEGFKPEWVDTQEVVIAKVNGQKIIVGVTKNPTQKPVGVELQGCVLILSSVQLVTEIVTERGFQNGMSESMEYAFDALLSSGLTKTFRFKGGIAAKADAVKARDTLISAVLGANR